MFVFVLNLIRCELNMYANSFLRACTYVYIRTMCNSGGVRRLSSQSLYLNLYVVCVCVYTAPVRLL